MSTTTRVLFLILAAMLLASCATAPQTIGAVGAGVAGLAGVFNELASGGVISPVQNLQAQHALEAIATTVSSTQQLAALAQQTAAAAKDGTLTVGEGAAGLTAGMGAVSIAINAWRNLTRKKAIAEVASPA